MVIVRLLADYNKKIARICLQNMNDQQQLWNELHKKGKAGRYSDAPADFAKEVAKIISPRSKILELGCGCGNDSAYFARQGYNVLAADFSNAAIENNRKRFKENNLRFEVFNTSKQTAFPDNCFDAVYACLSLHYFTDKATKKIFKEIHRILIPGGYLCFLCKSTDDPLYGQGKQIEKDMFEENGHIRHFFSEVYVKECLKGIFKIEQLATGREDFYNSPFAFIKVIAVRG